RFAQPRQQGLMAAMHAVEVADGERAGRARFGIGKSAKFLHWEKPGRESVEKPWIIRANLCLSVSATRTWPLRACAGGNIVQAIQTLADKRAAAARVLQKMPRRQPRRIPPAPRCRRGPSASPAPGRR